MDKHERKQMEKAVFWGTFKALCWFYFITVALLVVLFMPRGGRVFEPSSTDAEQRLRDAAGLDDFSHID